MFKLGEALIHLSSYLYLMFLVNRNFQVGTGKNVMKKHGFQTWLLFGNIYLLICLNMLTS